MLDFTISRPGPVRAELIDLGGRCVQKLLDGAYTPAGSHRLAVDGRNDGGQELPAGIYFYRLQAPEGRITGRLVFMR